MILEDMQECISDSLDEQGHDIKDLMSYRIKLDIEGASTYGNSEITIDNLQVDVDKCNENITLKIEVY